MPLNFEQSLIQTSYVYWCATNQPGSTRSRRLVSVGPEYRGYQLQNMVHLVFSPDSQRLAVVGPYKLELIDLETGRSKSLIPAGEIVTSLMWLGKNEIGYAAHTSRRGDYRQISDRTFWRQKVDQEIGSRLLIHREKGVENVLISPVPYFDWPVEHWSPKGNYVFYRRNMTGPGQMLDVSQGAVSADE